MSIWSDLAAASPLKGEAVSSPTTAPGSFAVIGNIDFDKMLSAKDLEGLFEYHLADLGETVLATFSSSTALHAFVLTASRKLYAYGRNLQGQLSTNDKVSLTFPSLVTVPTGSRIKKVACGLSHSILLLENGDVYGCGSNSVGEIGLPTAKDHLIFTQIPTLSDIVDVACGDNFSLFCSTEGRVYACGTQKDGVLGGGSNGHFIEKAGKDMFASTHTPAMISQFVEKDSHNKVVRFIKAEDVKIRIVAAGKSHAVCVECWGDGNDNTHTQNRVFTWGFGGYGRLGHTGADNEYTPRVINNFRYQTRDVSCGSAFSMLLTSRKSLFFFGKMSNAPRGESTMYPKMVMELIDYPIDTMSCGNNCIFAHSSSKKMTAAWGVPLSGLFGLKGDRKSANTPEIVSALDGYDISQVSCGYGHIAVIISGGEINKFKKLPKATKRKAEKSESSSKKIKAKK